MGVFLAAFLFTIKSKAKCVQNIVKQHGKKPYNQTFLLFLSGVNALPIGGAAPTLIH